MAFDTLITICHSTKTSFSDVGVGVSMQPKSDERVLFFDISKQERPNSFLRQDWNMQNDELLCDGIIFYATSSGNINQEKIVICLVEMKGTDVAHAIKQVKDTRITMEKALKKAANGKLYGELSKSIIWKAYICQRGNAESSLKYVIAQVEDARKFFGKDNFAIEKDRDIGKFLRK